MNRREYIAALEELNNQPLSPALHTVAWYSAKNLTEVFIDE